MWEAQYYQPKSSPFAGHFGRAGHYGFLRGHAESAQNFLSRAEFWVLLVIGGWHDKVRTGHDRSRKRSHIKIAIIIHLPGRKLPPVAGQIFLR